MDEHRWNFMDTPKVYILEYICVSYGRSLSQVLAIAAEIYLKKKWVVLKPSFVSYNNFKFETCLGYLLRKRVFNIVYTSHVQIDNFQDKNVPGESGHRTFPDFWFQIFSWFRGVPTSLIICVIFSHIHIFS